MKTFYLKTENISLCLRRKGRGCGSGQVLFNRKKYPKPAGKYPGLSYLRCQPSGVHPCSLVSFPGVSRSFSSGCRVLHLFSCVCCARWHGCSCVLQHCPAFNIRVPRRKSAGGLRVCSITHDPALCGQRALRYYGVGRNGWTWTCKRTHNARTYR